MNIYDADVARGGNLDSGAMGRGIRERRLALDMSQADLAARSGLAPSYISRLENGQSRRPGADRLEQLAGALGLRSWRDLLTIGAGGSVEGKAESPPPADGTALSDAPEVLGPDGRPLKPVDLGGGVIGYVPREIDPAAIPEASREAMRRMMSDVVREVVREELQGALRDVGGEVVRREITRAWKGHPADEQG